MKFHKNVTMFDFAGIPIVANYDNGIIIGLTAAGAEICRKLLVEDLDRSEISLVDQSLFDQLSNSCFFEGPRHPPALQTVYFHVTSRCDLTCQGCYSYKEGRNSCEDPSLECIKKALDEISSRGISQLVISGGEPFLRDDLPDIVAYAKEVCGIPSLAILSNGLHIDQSSLHRLSGHSPCISISFDGYSAESQAHIRGTQNFSKLIDSIKQIKSAGIQGHIIATIHALNIEDVLQYVTLSKKTWSYDQFQPDIVHLFRSSYGWPHSLSEPTLLAGGRIVPPWKRFDGRPSWTNAPQHFCKTLLWRCEKHAQY